MKEATPTQMKQLLKKLQSIQVKYYGEVFDLMFEINTYDGGKVLQNSINVYIVIGEEAKTFNFYQFRDKITNDETMHALNVYLKQLKAL